MNTDLPNTYSDVPSRQIIEDHESHGRNIGALAVSQAAAEDGASLDWQTRRVVWARLPDRRIPIIGHMGPESNVASAIVGDKILAKRLMADAGVPTPRGRRVRSAEDAILAQRQIGAPVVIKPRFGSMGRAVTVNISKPHDLRRAFERARDIGDVIVEQYHEGLEYRAHATDTECVGAFRRILPSVTGNGHTNIRDLVHLRNQLRLTNPTTRNYPIPMDEIAEEYLARQGLSWDSVIPDGARIVVRDVNGITSGGDSEECLDTVGSQFEATAVAAVASIPGMAWGGIDILVDSRTGIPYVMEINTDAAISGSIFPVYGQARPLGRTLWEQIRAHTLPEPTQVANPRLRLAKNPINISDAVRGADLQDPSIENLVRQSLSNRGHLVTIQNRRVWWSTSPTGERFWFNHLQTSRDLAIATYPLRRRVELWRILTDSKAPLPQGRQIRNSHDIVKFRDEQGERIALLPLRGQTVLGSNILDFDETFDLRLIKNPDRWFAQPYPQGLRLKLFTTPHEVLAAVTANPEKLRHKTFVRAERTAISAVRALPQLAWAVVDILLRPGRLGTTTLLIENISMRGMFDREDMIIAGSFDRVVDLILSRSVATK